MKPSFLFLAAALALLFPHRVLAAGPGCAAGDAGSSTNWGPDFRERTQQIFETVKSAAGVTQEVKLIYTGDLAGKAAGERMIDGTPLGAVPKGTHGLATDAVFYTMGIFEIVCDESQMAFFMAHEMRHLKVVDGKSHFDRVKECNKKVLNDWTASTDLSAYATPDDAVKAFQTAKGDTMATTCTLPVENEADAFAFDLLPKLPYKFADNSNNPAQPGDARVAAFKRAGDWLTAIGANTADKGHGDTDTRKTVAAAKAWQSQLKTQQEAEKKAGQTMYGPH